MDTKTTQSGDVTGPGEQTPFRAMDRKQARLLLMIISIVYGCGVAVLSTLHSGATEMFSVIGGGVVAINWVSFGVLFVRSRDHHKESE